MMPLIKVYIRGEDVKSYINAKDIRVENTGFEVLQKKINEFV